MVGLHTREHRRDRGRIRYVTGDGRRGFAEFCGQGVEPVAPPCREDHMHALGYEQPSGRLADAARRPGDDRHLASEILHLHV